MEIANNALINVRNVSKQRITVLNAQQIEHRHLNVNALMDLRKLMEFANNALINVRNVRGK